MTQVLTPPGRIAPQHDAKPLTKLKIMVFTFGSIAR
jgi:hypothetical protein